MTRLARHVEMNVLRILVIKPERNYHLQILGVDCIVIAS
jgi:hypothetical protein